MTTFLESIAGDIREMVTAQNEWGRCFQRFQMLSDDILGFAIDGSEWYANFIYSKYFYLIVEMMLGQIQDG